MKNIIALGALLLLTATAVYSSNTIESSNYLVLTVLGLGVIKLLLVTFQFMELKKAHPFWKAAITLVVGLFLTISSILLH